MFKGRFALGALIGAVAGVIAGVLTAPKSGKETRTDLKNKAAELKVEAAKRADEVKTRSGEIVSEVKDKVEGYKERGEYAASGTIDGAKKSFYNKK